MEVRVRSATEKELDLCSNILQEAVRWLNEKQMPLWNIEEILPDRLLIYVQKKELFVAITNDVIAGLIVLLDEDVEFWPEVEGGSLFFHKLAVRREYAGQGVSQALIDFSIREAGKRRRRYLRMDCSAKHPKLRKFYHGIGFRFVDQKQVGRYLVDRMEMVL